MGLSRFTLGALIFGLSACAPRLQDLIAERHYDEALAAVGASRSAAPREQLSDALIQDLLPQVHLEVGQVVLPGSKEPLSVLRVRVTGNAIPLSGEDLLSVEGAGTQLLPVHLEALAARLGETMPKCHEAGPGQLAQGVGGVLLILSLGLLRPDAGSRSVCPTAADKERAMPLATALSAQLHHGCEARAGNKELRCMFDFLLPAASQSPGAGPIPLSFLFHFRTLLPANSRSRVRRPFDLIRHYELLLPPGTELSTALAERFGRTFQPLTRVAQQR